MALPYTSILAGASGQSSGYSITNSARFVSGNSAYLSHTNGTPTSQQIWTLNVQVKRSELGRQQSICSSGTDDEGWLYFGSDDKLAMQNAVGANLFKTTQVFRDVAGWYDICITNSTGSVLRVYVNGTQVTAFDTDARSGYTWTNFNKSGVVFYLGRRNSSPAANYMAGYFSNYYFIDGQQLTPSSFGQTNTSGVWVPKAYSGTYGTNGFLMAFLNSAALGTDTSGNGNTFTSSGLVAGDQMTDTPTNIFCTINPLDNDATVITAGNLKVSASTTKGWRGTFGMSAGKWYWETVMSGYVGNTCMVAGIRGVNTAWTTGNHLGWYPDGYAIYALNGNKYNNNSNSAYGSAVANGTVVATAYDADNGKVYWGTVSGGAITWFNSGDPVAGTGAAYTGLTGTFAPAASPDNTTTLTLNFGATAFAASALPTGFLALNSTNLPAPAIKDGSAHFQTALHTGTGSAITINQSGNSTFTSDFVWTKGRSGATDHILSNVISGTGKYLKSNSTAAEVTDAQALTAFGAGSISYGTLAAANTNAATYVDWMWKGGGAGVSNTSGSITSTVSANTTAGISIVGYTGTGANATVGHGLGKVPGMVIIKDTGASASWPVIHQYDTSCPVGHLNTTAAFNAALAASMFQSTFPSSSVITLGADGVGEEVNVSAHTYVAICFAPIAGFSSMGQYTGNGSAAGPFIYTGFSPALVIVKCTTTAYTWTMYDNKRPGYNPPTDLSPNNTGTDGANAFTIDETSNGFKIRVSNASMNESGSTFIYAAFASNPFGGSGAAPATAR